MRIHLGVLGYWWDGVIIKFGVLSDGSEQRVWQE